MVKTFSVWWEVTQNVWSKYLSAWLWQACPQMRCPTRSGSRVTQHPPPKSSSWRTVSSSGNHSYRLQFFFNPGSIGTGRYLVSELVSSTVPVPRYGMYRYLFNPNGTNCREIAYRHLSDNWFRDPTRKFFKIKLTTIPASESTDGRCRYRHFSKYLLRKARRDTEYLPASSGNVPIFLFFLSKRP